MGIALVLDPSMKLHFLKDNAGWTTDWVDTVEQIFVEAYNFYKSKQQNALGSALQSVVQQNEVRTDKTAISNFLKRKRPQIELQSESEYQRFFFKIN